MTFTSGVRFFLCFTIVYILFMAMDLLKQNIANYSHFTVNQT